MPNLTTWLLELGISHDVLMVLTFVPIIVTITSLSRYILGIKTFGVYTSMILAFAYYFMGARQGLILTIVVLFSSWLVRNLIKKTKLHYISRLAVVYCGISALVLSFIVATTFIPSNDPVFNFTNILPLPLAMIISITDRFLANHIKKDLLTATRLSTETILIAFIGWALIRIESIQEILINNLWLIPVVIIINLMIGKYSGFRWTEHLRFSKVIKNTEDDQTE